MNSNFKLTDLSSNISSEIHNLQIPIKKTTLPKKMLHDELSDLTFLFVFPSSTDDHLCIASNGARILSTQKLDKGSIYKMFPSWKTVMCNSYNLVHQSFIGYALLTLPGNNTNATPEMVKNALVFDLNDRKRLAPAIGHISQDSLLMVTTNQDTVSLIDNKCRMKSIADGRGYFNLSEINSHYNMVVVPPDQEIPPISRCVRLSPELAPKAGQYVNFWGCIQTNNYPLFSSGIYGEFELQTKSGTKAYAAIAWMKYGAALAGSTLEDEIALGVVDTEDLSEEIDLPPTMPSPPKRRDPFTQKAFEMLSQTHGKTLPTKTLVKSLNSFFGMSLALPDFVLLINLFPGFSSGFDETMLIWD